MDVDIEPEDAPRDVPRGKSICHSLNTKNKLVFISFDLETGGKRWDNGLRFAFINGLRQCTPVCEFQVVPCFLPSWMLNLSSLALSRKWEWERWCQVSDSPNVITDIQIHTDSKLAWRYIYIIKCHTRSSITYTRSVISNRFINERKILDFAF